MASPFFKLLTKISALRCITSTLNTIIKLLFQRLKIPHSRVYLDKKINSFLYTNSFYGIQQILLTYSIKSLCISIPIEELSNVELPVISTLKLSEKEFIIITKYDSGFVECLTEKNILLRKSKMDFNNDWGKSVLLMDFSEFHKEIGYSWNRLLDLINDNFFGIFIISIFIILFSCFTLRLEYSKINTLLSYQLFFLFFFGASISILIFLKSIEYKSQILDNVCFYKRKNNCEILFNGSENKLFGLFKWVDIGIIYFFGGLISVSTNPKVESLLLFLNICALPISMLAIYFLYKLKKWCVLCVSIHSIIIIIFILLCLNKSIIKVTELTALEYVAIVFSFVLPLMFIWFFEPFSVRQKSTLARLTQLREIKSNLNIFQFLLNNGRYANEIENEYSICLGKNTSTTSILIILSPFCKYCRELYEQIELLLFQKNQNIQVRIIFSPSENRFQGEIIKYLVGLYLRFGCKPPSKSLHFR